MEEGRSPLMLGTCTYIVSQGLPEEFFSKMNLLCKLHYSNMHLNVCQCAQLTDWKKMGQRTP